MAVSVAATTISRVAGRGSGGRFYKIAQGAHVEVYPSVTSILGMLDKSALVPWAIRTSLDVVKSELTSQVEMGCADLIPQSSLSGAPPQSDNPSTWIQRLIDKAAAAPDAAKSTAASFGTKAHEAIDAIIKGEPSPFEADSDVAPVVEGFRRWYAGSGIVLCPAGDTAVYSRTYRYAGAADCLGYRPSTGALVVLDFKTSNRIQGSYALQLAAYAHAVREMWASGELDVQGLVMKGKESSTQQQHLTVEAPGVSTNDAGRLREPAAISNSSSRDGGNVETTHKRREPSVGPNAYQRFAVESHDHPPSTIDPAALSGLDSLGGLLTGSDLAGLNGIPMMVTTAVEKGKQARRSSSRTITSSSSVSVSASSVSSTATGTSGSKPASSKPRKPKAASDGDASKSSPIVDEHSLMALVGMAPPSSSANSGTSSNTSPAATAAADLLHKQQKAQFSTSSSSAALFTRAILSSDGRSGFIPAPCTSTLFSRGVRRRQFGTSNSAAESAVAASSVSLAAADGRPAVPTVGNDAAASDAAHETLATAESGASDGSGPEGVPIEALIVRLDKGSGLAEVKRVRDLGAAFDAFKAALLLWHTVGPGAASASQQQAAAGPPAAGGVDGQGLLEAL